MTLYVLALLIGVIAGLRAMTAPAAVAWGAHLGWIPLAGTPLAWLGGNIAIWILTALAAVELITDQLPMTPSRKVPPQFGARIVAGGFSGAAIGFAGGSWIVGAILGVVGAVIGALGGAELRSRLAKAFKRDTPAALVEDVIALGGAYLIVSAVS
ncbi:DUF4126 domain-containing protein [Caulobacter flavus]|uniref:DUF4126 domain-containing protein n=1 Tax=Caulobacter flavus TaxID=1679497 RepID=A0A2N5CU05_9CAUL|nr:DUF4126 family protein [Caulobacter flavus]AYV45760.1 DUF4126 domain-containing protein [Caulobacter flavus]PLR15796.1 DUF4126 domain-containing protein [Caulobacter flavus]